MSDSRNTAEKARAQNLLQQGRVNEAAAIYQAITQNDPGDAEAWSGLGSIYGQLKAGPPAEACFRRVTALRPELPYGHFNLALALEMQDRNADAVASYIEAIRLKPDFIEAIHNLGLAQSREGDFEEALATLAQGLALQPGHVRITSVQAEIHARRGDYQKAYDVLKPLLEGPAPPPVGVVATLGLFSKHINASSQAIALHKRLLEDNLNPLAQAERMLLHFSLGHLLDAAGEYDAAFTQFQQGNSFKERRFDARKLINRYDSFIAAYSEDFMRRAPRAARDASRLIFIVGMPRSGTTLVEQILSSHPQVEGLGERLLLPSVVQTIPQVLGSTLPYPQCMSEFTGDAANSLADAYMREVDALVGNAGHVTDKMLQNYEHLGLIALLFPGARVIHCTRNPLDTCLSCYFVNFRSDSFAAYDLSILGLHYRQYERLMAHWRTVLDIPRMDVSYEDLIADQERVTRELLTFCGLPWDDSCLRFHETGRAVVTASYDQVRQPLYRRSAGRWKHYDRHLGPLRSALTGGDGG